LWPRKRPLVEVWEMRDRPHPWGSSRPAWLGPTRRSGPGHGFNRMPGCWSRASRTSPALPARSGRIRANRKKPRCVTTLARLPSRSSRSSMPRFSGAKLSVAVAADDDEERLGDRGRPPEALGARTGVAWRRSWVRRRPPRTTGCPGPGGPPRPRGPARGQKKTSWVRRRCCGKPVRDADDRRRPQRAPCRRTGSTWRSTRANQNPVWAGNVPFPRWTRGFFSINFAIGTGRNLKKPTLGRSCSASSLGGTWALRKWTRPG